MLNNCDDLINILHMMRDYVSLMSQMVIVSFVFEGLVAKYAE